MTTVTGPARDVLTQQEAAERAARVSGVEYDLTLAFRRGAGAYLGDCAIRFDLAGHGDLFLDFRGKTIESLTLNGEPLEPAWDGYRLTLPAARLEPENRLRVVYENEYDRTGEGLHHFVDPEDGEEYLYTHFEPFNAHRMFPCFDQPDIKGVTRLIVTAPAEWVVLGNGRALQSSSEADGRTRHVFEALERFSTYLVALAAGPYQEWRDEHKGLPLGFYCRRALAKYFDPDELFTITKQGFDFFQAFFDFPYPFTKYDQVCVPEFNAGAMENVGLVTHYERLIFRDPPTDTQRLGRAEIVLHEMAHMWFGDLVTMKWWDDLWLNESFASYMAYLAMVNATRFTSAWKEFNSGMKTWAYRQDQLVTTHPIAGEVPDTDATFLNFDGITYGKGAAALQQLVAAIGLERFRDGMRRYFRDYAWGNTTLAQFLGSLEEGSGRDLKRWAELWLETPSLNTLAAQWTADGDRLAGLSLTQTAPAEHATLRPHHVEVGLVRDEGHMLRIEALPADLEGAEAEVAGAAGRPAPSMVFPNYNDLTFAKVALDPRSVAFVRGNLDRVSEPLLRQQLWQSLWNMVRDRQLKSTDFLALAREKLPIEPDLEIVEAVLRFTGATLTSYVPEDRRDAESHATVEAWWRALRAAPQGDAQITWARALIGTTLTAEDVALTARLADGEVSVPGLTVDQEMRWTVAVKAVARALPGADARVAAERERDPSDRGQRMVLRAGAAPADAAVKAATWERVHGDGYGSLHLTAAAMSGFNWSFQSALLAPYVDAFFERVPGVFEGRSHEFAAAYFSNLFPSYRVEQDTLDRTERLIAALGDGQPVLTRMLREAGDDLARSIACRAYAAT